MANCWNGFGTVFQFQFQLEPTRYGFSVAVPIWTYFTFRNSRNCFETVGTVISLKVLNTQKRPGYTIRFYGTEVRNGSKICWNGTVRWYGWLYGPVIPTWVVNIIKYDQLEHILENRTDSSSSEKEFQVENSTRWWYWNWTPFQFQVQFRTETEKQFQFQYSLFRSVRSSVDVTIIHLTDIQIHQSCDSIS